MLTERLKQVKYKRLIINFTGNFSRKSRIAHGLRRLSWEVCYHKVAKKSAEQFLEDRKIRKKLFFSLRVETLFRLCSPVKYLC